MKKNMDEDAQAGSSSGEPATGEPSQGSDAAPMGPNVLMIARSAGLEYRRTRGLPREGAPPPLCNRVNSEWGAQEMPCSCQHWPGWLMTHAGTDAVKNVTEEIEDSEKKRMLVAHRQNVKYWRPGFRGRKWWYTGWVRIVRHVMFPSGRSKVVLGVN